MTRPAEAWIAAERKTWLALVMTKILVTMGCSACALARLHSVREPPPNASRDPSDPLKPPATGQPKTATAPSVTEVRVTKQDWPSIPKGFKELIFNTQGAPVTGQAAPSAAASKAAIRFFARKPPEAPTPQFVALADLNRITLDVAFAAGEGTSRITQNCRHGINGGYFSESSSLSIVKSKGVLHSRDAQPLNRPQGKAEPTRGTFFWDRSRRRAIFNWASVVHGSIQSFSQPADPYTDKRKGGTAAPPHSDALGAGPLLLQASKIVLNPERESFDAGISPRSNAPRSAMGVTATGYLLTMVADGRRPGAPGLTLQKLAESLKEWGVTAGLNLDGGASSTFVVSGRVINTPSNGKERLVTSALCLREN